MKYYKTSINSSYQHIINTCINTFREFLRIQQQTILQKDKYQQLHHTFFEF